MAKKVGKWAFAYFYAKMDIFGSFCGLVLELFWSCFGLVRTEVIMDIQTLFSLLREINIPCYEERGKICIFKDVLFILLFLGKEAHGYYAGTGFSVEADSGA